MNAHLFSHPSWVEVNLDQFRKNLSLVKKNQASPLFCLPIKANAYGHGLVPIARTAQDFGIDYLAVAHLQEGMVLRNEGIAIPILVLGAIHENQIADLLEYDLEFSISSLFKAELVAKQCAQMGKQAKVHLEVDTGMQRTGVRPLTAVPLYEYLLQTGHFSVVGIYTHLATGDSPDDPIAKEQIASFRTLLSDPIFEGRPLIRHLANSLGTLHFPEAHFDMVRCSLLAFGYPPKGAPPPFNELAPCFTLKSTVSYFKVVEKGKGVSYGHAYITPKTTRIVTIPIGYGDGYLRALSGKASVLIRGKRYPIVGNICMDQFMCDIGDDEVHVGDEVVLIGKQGGEEIPLSELAEAAGTIPYEILCLLNNRLPRRYT